MSKLIIYDKKDIQDYNKKELILAKNAFVLPNGNFILAGGYKDENATYLVEQSAREISLNLRPKQNLLEEYRDYIKNDQDAERFYYLREILIHYYGLALFAKTNSLTSARICDKRFPNFIIPNEAYFDQSATNAQLQTILNLIYINEEDSQELDQYQITKK